MGGSSRNRQRKRATRSVPTQRQCPPSVGDYSARDYSARDYSIRDYSAVTTQPPQGQDGASGVDTNPCRYHPRFGPGSVDSLPFPGRRSPDGSARLAESMPGVKVLLHAAFDAVPAAGGRQPPKPRKRVPRILRLRSVRLAPLRHQLQKRRNVTAVVGLPHGGLAELSDGAERRLRRVRFSPLAFMMPTTKILRFSLALRRAGLFL